MTNRDEVRKNVRNLIGFMTTYAKVPLNKHWLHDQEKIHLGRDERPYPTLYASASICVHKEAVLSRYPQKSLEKMLCLGVAEDGSASFHQQGEIETPGLSTSAESMR